MAEGTKARVLDWIEEHNASSGVGSFEHTFFFIHVKKGKGDGEVEIENPRYTIILDRTKGHKLGMKLETQGGTRSLFIKEVMSGLAFNWNKAHRDLQVRPGDRIVRINEVQGDATALMEESKKKARFEIELHRGSALAITAGLRVTLKNDFGVWQTNMEGSVDRVDDEGDAQMRINGRKQWVNKQDYDKFIFEDSNKYYLKRYCDFQELHAILEQGISSGGTGPIKKLITLPETDKLGFRKRTTVIGGAAEANQHRMQKLQEWLDDLLKQSPRLEMEPSLNKFFGASPIPDSVVVAKQEILKQRLEVLTYRHRALEEAKAQDGVVAK